MRTQLFCTLLAALLFYPAPGAAAQGKPAALSGRDKLEQLPLAPLKPTDSLDVHIWIKTPRVPPSHRPGRTASRDSVTSFAREHDRRLKERDEAQYRQYGLPLVQHLEKQGYRVKVSKSPLIISGRLSRRTIEQIARRQEVDTIYQDLDDTITPD